MNISFRKNSDSIVSIFLFGLVFLTSYFFSRIGVDVHHDGFILKPALDMLHGKVLYKEVFSQYGPLADLLNLAFLELFGAKLVSIRIGASLSYAFTGSFLYLMGRRFLKRAISIFMVVIWLSLAPYISIQFLAWSSVYGTLFFTVVLYLTTYAFAVSKKSVSVNPAVVFMIGVFSSLSFWTRQPNIFLFLVWTLLPLLLGYYKVIKRPEIIRTYKYLLSGFFLISMLIVAWLVFQGSIVDFILQNYLFGFVWTYKVGRGYFDLSILLNYLKNPVFILMPLLLIIFLRVKLIGKNNKIKAKELPIIAVAIVSLSILAMIFPYGDSRHLYWALTPTFPVVFYIVFVSKIGQSARNAVLLLFLILTLVTILIRLPNSIERLRKSYYELKRPEVLEGLIVEKEDWDYINEVDSVINKYFKMHPEKRMVNLGTNPLYMAFTQKSKNIATLYHDYSGYTSRIYDYRGKMDEYIEENKPLVISEDLKLRYLDGYCFLYRNRERSFSVLAERSKEAIQLECID